MLFPSSYNPALCEDKIYRLWEKSGFFNPDKLRRTTQSNASLTQNNAELKTFSIAMPPPNATGELHIGHAMFLTLQDLMTRYHRMKGDIALWLPGTDHAAIATQTRVEKNLLKIEGKTRQSLGREKFLELVNSFVENSRQTIRKQIRKMGSSCDWSRERYTLDAGLTMAVQEVFVRMYNDGLIYRGDRIINWCPRCESTLADDEVEYREQLGKLYYIIYKLKVKSEKLKVQVKNLKLSKFKDYIVVATTRPETMFGDTAVAVNPQDKRYIKLIGQKVILPLVGRELTIIADKTIDPKFGAGAVKITPCHDQNDFAVGQRHNLEKIKIFTDNGQLNDNAPFKYQKLDRFKARQIIVADLNQQGLIDKIENHLHNVGYCYRCDTVIEPMVSKQWFVSVSSKFKVQSSKLRKIIGKEQASLKEIAVAVVKSGEIKIIPKRFEKIYYHWMENLRDWCISRQIWFGHRMPVWYYYEKVKSEKLKVKSTIQAGNKIWNLKIYGQNIFTMLLSGAKKIETRAGKPQGSEKYWGDFKAGDIVEFNLADEKTDKIIASQAPIKKIVKKVVSFKTIDDMLKVYKPDDIIPGKSTAEIKKWWARYPDFIERIKKYGIWAIELEEFSPIETQEMIKVQAQSPGPDWAQDTDTLDTWFSSGLWTFSTLGWPKTVKSSKFKVKSYGEMNDLEKFHPTSVMETGYDILPLWVSRMILMSIYALGEAPFKTVYLHGLVRDKQGRKMSKSLGNGIDPLDMIKKYGADVVRLSLIIGATPGNDIRLYEEKIVGYRNFITKIWNIARYIIIKSKIQIKNQKYQNNNLILPAESADGQAMKQFNNETMNPSDKWILYELSELVKRVNKNLEKFQFSRAGEDIYEFIWHKLADWYIEMTKKENLPHQPAILCYILEKCLVLLHPFVPFVTEEIWEIMNYELRITNYELLIIKPWVEKIDFKISKTEAQKFSKTQREIIKKRAVIKEDKKKRQISAKELAGLKIYVQTLKDRLKNKGFLTKAPQAVIKSEKEKLRQALKKLNQLA